MLELTATSLSGIHFDPTLLDLFYSFLIKTGCRGVLVVLVDVTAYFDGSGIHFL